MAKLQAVMAQLRFPPVRSLPELRYVRAPEPLDFPEEAQPVCGTKVGAPPDETARRRAHIEPERPH
jgi:hypothetical protein